MSACAASRKHEGHKQPLMPPASGGRGIGTRKVSLAHQHSPSFEGEQSNSLPQRSQAIRSGAMVPISVGAHQRLVPCQRTTILVFDDATLEEVLFLLQIHRFRHPRERIVHGGGGRLEP
jgi:hypothetical protein